jgi:uncharacterized membrane protein
VSALGAERSEAHGDPTATSGHNPTVRKLGTTITDKPGAAPNPTTRPGPGWASSSPMRCRSASRPRLGPAGSTPVEEFRTGRCARGRLHHYGVAMEKQAMSSRRTEAFSDGVFAIAITLLVLDLVVPSRQEAAEGGLGHALAHEWPAYFAYLVSFLIIGIIWVNHHTMFDKVRLVDRPVLFANLALLLVVSLIPFPTRLLAEYLTAGDGAAHVAAAVYSATMLAMGLAYTTLWLTLTRDANLLHEGINPRSSRAALRRFGIGNVFYLATIGLSLVSAPITLAVHAALAIYYCFDQLPTIGTAPTLDPIDD